MVSLSPDKLRKRAPRDHFTVKILLLLSAAIFLVEFLIMGFLFSETGAEKNPLLTAIFDSAVLTLVLFPVLIRFVYYPLVAEMTVRKRAELELRSVFDSSPNVVLMVNSDGLVTLANLQAERLFGYPHEELIGQSVSLLVPERFKPFFEVERKTSMETSSARQLGVKRDFLGRHKDGHEVPLEVVLTPTIYRGESAVLTTIVNIASRKEAERQRDEALKAREELVGIVSHEIKNPLTALGASLQLIQRSLPDFEKKVLVDKLIGQSLGSVKLMTRITSDLLDVTRIESGRFSLRWDEVHVEQLVDELISIFSTSAAQRRIRLEKKLSFLTQVITCDHERILQVLSNLVSNAIKFAPEGGLVRIRVEMTGDHLFFEVSDNGPGIAPEESSRVFERFWQSKEHAHLGTGLGLYIAKNIIEAHRGRIGVKSQAGQGSQFFFTLPLKPSQTHQAA